MSLVKNVTMESDPAGAKEILAYEGDVLRNLLVIQNYQDADAMFELEISWPEGVSVLSGTTESDSNDGRDWQKIGDVNQIGKIDVPSNGVVFLRYDTQVTGELPNENLILANSYKVVDENSGVEMQSLTEIYLPNFEVGADLSEKYQDLPVEEQIRLEEKMLEERALIEADFEKIKQGMEKSESVVESEDCVDWIYWVCGGVGVFLIIVFAIYLIKHKKYENKDDENNFIA